MEFYDILRACERQDVTPLVAKLCFATDMTRKIKKKGGLVNRPLVM